PAGRRSARGGSAGVVRAGSRCVIGLGEHRYSRAASCALGDALKGRGELRDTSTNRQPSDNPAQGRAP
ncbi:hypothetical protein, partial [Streptomyces sp. NPDC003832]